MTAHIHETLCGVVSEVLGEQVEVTYETPKGPLKQIYDRNQFSDGKLPSEGDDVVALTTVIFSKHAVCHYEPW